MFLFHSFLKNSIYEYVSRVNYSKLKTGGLNANLISSFLCSTVDVKPLLEVSKSIKLPKITDDVIRF